MSGAQAAAVSITCCCPEESYTYCTPPHSAVLVTMAPIRFKFGCYYHSWNQEIAVSCEGFANGSRCDGPQWECDWIQNRTGSVTPVFVMRRIQSGGLYATVVDCANGINDGYFGGSIEGERPAEYTGWRNVHDGEWLLARDAWVGTRSCVPQECVSTCKGVQCLGISQDQSKSGFLVHAVLQPSGPYPEEIGGPCSPLAPQGYTVSIKVRVMSTQSARDWCQCNPTFKVPPLTYGGFDSAIVYAKNCCPETPGGGVRGTYRAITPTKSPLAFQYCSNDEDAEPVAFTPWEFPLTLTVS